MGWCRWPKMNAVSSPPNRTTHPDATLLVSAVEQVIAVWPAGRRHGGRRPWVPHRRERPAPCGGWRPAGRAGPFGHARQVPPGLRVDPPFKRMRNWRVGIEARISQLERGFGLRRTRLRRPAGAQTWVGLGIFAPPRP
jgi:hypothetical protein